MLKKTSLSNLKYKKVLGSQGRNIGVIRDAVVNRDNLNVRGYVIYGSTVEELLERIGAKTDVDPLIKMDNIAELTNDHVKLNKTKEELPNAMENGEIKENEILFSQLTKIPIYSNKGDNMGFICDIYFSDDSSPNFTLGGVEFLNFLRLNNCTPAVEYALPADKFTKIDKGYKINQEIKELEREIKHNFYNIIRDILVEAERDGKITDEESALINEVKIEMPVYLEALAKAEEDNVITKEEEMELEKIKDQLIHKVVMLARKDNVVTDDEKALIKKLANYMVDKRDILFWRIFGTTA